MRRLKGVRLYPFLMAGYPALALLASNIAQVRVEAVVRPLLLSLALGAVVYALTWLALRETDRAALLTTWMLVLFFSYGHVYDLLAKTTLSGETLGRHRYLVVVWVALLVIGSVALLRVRQPRRMAGSLNLVFAVAVLLPVLQTAVYLTRSSALGVSAQERSGLPEGQALRPVAGQPLPDVYYIILDGYGRSDTLDKVYGYDNTAFLQQLKDLGFVVATCSQSNYAQTEMSLATSMNLVYLDALGDTFKPGTDDRLPLVPLLRHSAVRKALEGLGYRTVAFDTGFTFTSLDDADLYLSPRFRGGLGGGMSGFELMFLRSTAGLIALDTAKVVPALLAPELHRPETEHRERVLFTFDQLGRVASEPGPKFVFAHIVSPHDPFVFGKDGEPVDYSNAPPAGAWELQAYADQAQFVSGRTIQVLKAILAHSSRPPVIILQGDHGPGWGSHEGRMGILNAYLFPGADRAVYPSITPVNSFRILFNAEFGTGFALLPDVSYFSIYATPFDFTVIPNTCSP